MIQYQAQMLVRTRLNMQIRRNILSHGAQFVGGNFAEDSWTPSSYFDLWRSLDPHRGENKPFRIGIAFGDNFPWRMALERALFIVLLSSWPIRLMPQPRKYMS